MAKQKSERKPLDKNLFSTNKSYKRSDVKDAKKWFRDQIASIGTDPKGRQTDLRFRGNLNPIGRMSYFAYKAEGDGTLPYWDKTPLTIMISETKSHYMGLNLHYLPPKLRALLLQRLIELMNNVKFDRSSYLNMSYQILQAASKYRYFKPCLKQYRKANFKSKIQIIRPEQWAKAILLPTANFKGASAKAVWADSKRIARN